MEKDRYSLEPFGKTLGKLLSEKYGDEMGRFSLKEFYDRIADRLPFGYENFRLLVKGARPLSQKYLNIIAEALDIEPGFFLEYRNIWLASTILENPKLGMHLFRCAQDFLRGQEAGLGDTDTGRGDDSAAR